MSNGYLTTHVLDIYNGTPGKGIKGSIAEIETSKDWINMRIKALIARQLWSDEGFYRAVNKDDRMIVKALDLFNNTSQY